MSRRMINSDVLLRSNGIINKYTRYLLFAGLGILYYGCGGNQRNAAGNTEPVKTEMTEKPQKMAVYQLLVRLFGNKKTGGNIHYGTLEQNGCGKFNDVTDTALVALKELGITHVWYTGVIEHATSADYTRYGIRRDDADVVKGRAGSPYAIKDYYDVDPDLAVNVDQRMKEFERLVDRTHKQGLKVLIDFIPNHVARSYHSDVKPAGIADFGEHDDVTKAFSSQNDFYYCPGEKFRVPTRIDVPVKFAKDLKMDGYFDEKPAKATGNNVFKATPSVDDWFETVKLNYGVDYNNGEKKHFETVPPVWNKMLAILSYWAGKGVDGFRCDVAEMVPVEFWEWVIPKVKAKHSQIIFLAEAYDPAKYQLYLTRGHFDFLYDKVGLYDVLKSLIREEPKTTTDSINGLVKRYERYPDKMLRFLENHDEERIASAGFAGRADKAIPGMVISATLSGSPLMVYFGQEVGEPGKGIEGFGGDDNRTTIFDYWAVPEHQKWMNGGRFDGGMLSAGQKALRSFYQRLITFAVTSPEISGGNLLVLGNTGNKKCYSYWRYTDKEATLVAANFDYKNAANIHIYVPEGWKDYFSHPKLSGQDILSAVPARWENIEKGISVGAGKALVIQFKR